MLGVNEHMGLKLFGRGIIFEEFQRMWSRYLIVTDGQTDRQFTVASPRSALASRGNKEIQYRNAALQQRKPRSQVYDIVYTHLYTS